ncbi:MAG: hypothetical protein ACRDQG_05285 [Pseudonocardiaceae bacterium]
MTPRAIPDLMWDELFAAMTCDRDRTLLLCYVSSGARASELLGDKRADALRLTRLTRQVHLGMPG